LLFARTTRINVNLAVWTLIMTVNLNGVNLFAAPHAICKNHK
jgi:hypothetical protein